MGSQPQHKTALLTAEAYLDLGLVGRSELIRGEVVTLSPSGNRHGLIASRIHLRLGHFVEQHRLGETFVADAGFILSRKPDTVRAPDVSFVSSVRLREVGIVDGFFVGAPDLAVEVVSPSDRWVEVEEKVIEFLTAGTREVWVVDPRHSAIRIDTGKAPSRLFQKAEVLVSELFPGFSLPLSELFS